MKRKVITDARALGAQGDVVNADVAAEAYASFSDELYHVPKVE